MRAAILAVGAVLALGIVFHYEGANAVLDLASEGDGSDVDTLARTIWGEARGEGTAGMEAVACVVMNRYRRPGWWSRNPDHIPDDTIAAVCRDPYQFSCWNPTDPNRLKVLGVTEADPLFRQALAIARRAVAGQLPDRTGGATHYYARYIAAPSWAASMRQTASIGVHRFFA